MSKPNRIPGTGYVARIKDPKDTRNIHKKRDLLYAPVYVDHDDVFDYNKLRNIVQVSNNLILYTSRVDKSQTEFFTWQMCEDTMAQYPPVGPTCQILKDKPISIRQFVEEAYSMDIMSDHTAYNKLVKSCPNPGDIVQRINLDKPTVVKSAPSLLSKTVAMAKDLENR